MNTNLMELRWPVAAVEPEPQSSQVDQIILSLFALLDTHRSAVLGNRNVVPSDLRAACRALCEANEIRAAERTRECRKHEWAPPK
jgi:hypothetical protein